METTQKLLEHPVKVINIGLEMFYLSLKKRGVDVVHLDWKPSASGNTKLSNLLKKIQS